MPLLGRLACLAQWTGVPGLAGWRAWLSTLACLVLQAGVPGSADWRAWLGSAAVMQLFPHSLPR